MDKNMAGMFLVGGGSSSRVLPLLSHAVNALLIRRSVSPVSAFGNLAILFEDTSAGATPLSYFIENAPLSADEKRLYAAWHSHANYGFFSSRIITGEEVHLAALAGGKRYRVYEQQATTPLKEGAIVRAVSTATFLASKLISTPNWS
jgi:hypothetical protein